MQTTSVGRLRRALGWLPSGLVVAGLLGLLAWGHATHWKLPKFSEMFGSQSSAVADRSDSGTHASGIRFRSVDAGRRLGIELAVVESRPVEEFVVAHGVVDYDQTRLAQLSARAAGIVWRVEKHLGDFVHQGELLAIIDSGEVGRAKSELLAALAASWHKQETVQRLRSVGDAVSERTLREAQAELRVARFRVFNAQQAIVNLGLPIDSDKLEGLSDQDLVRRVQFLGLPESIAEELDATRTTANLLPVRAPFDGVVTNREIVIGEVIDPARPQLTIADVGRMWLQLEVRHEDAPRLFVGQPIRFITDGVRGELATSLRWIGTQVNEKTRTVQVRAEVENPKLHPNDPNDHQRLLRAHAFGTARIRVRQSPRAIAVAKEAVQWSGERHVVYVTRDQGHTFSPREVSVGAAWEGFLEIEKGLAEGEVVAAQGSHLLKSETSRASLQAGR